jgi:hypothetical protein
MRIFVLTATYELRVSRKSHLRDHPSDIPYQKKNSSTDTSGTSLHPVKPVGCTRKIFYFKFIGNQLMLESNHLQGLGGAQYRGKAELNY